MDDLPPGVLHDVLSRLPIQLLMQYRSVCKSWLSIIDDPYFRKVFPSEQGTVMMFGCADGQEETGPILYKLLGQGERMRSVEIARFPELGLFRYHNSPTCNGFLLLERWDESHTTKIEIAVVNPVTKEMVRVSASPYTPVYFNRLFLGFDPSTSTYKLVQLLVLDHQDQVSTAVYDLGNSGCWRCCYPSSNAFIYDRDTALSHGVCVSGTLHWVCRCREMAGGGYMLSFDLGGEFWRTVSLPVDLNDSRIQMELMDIRGVSIGLCEISIKQYLSIWVIREREGSRQWIQKWNIYLNWGLSTHEMLGLYFCGDSIVSRHLDRTVVKRKRNSKTKTKTYSMRQHKYFYRFSLDKKVQGWKKAKDELPSDVRFYCARLNLGRMKQTPSKKN